jgi:hypothetical protein
LQPAVPPPHQPEIQQGSQDYDDAEYKIMHIDPIHRLCGYSRHYSMAEESCCQTDS